MPSNQAALHCPLCKQIDSVYKVSALYDHGFSTETYQRLVPPPPGTSWAPLLKTEERTVQSQLSRKLSPPPRPQPSDIRIPLVALFIVVAIPFLCIAGDSRGGFVAIIPVLVIGGLMNWWGLSYMKKEKEKVANLMPSWEMAMLLWRSLYYCIRDDIVFNPPNGSYSSASQMQTHFFR